jgi:predicted kinase
MPATLVIFSGLPGSGKSTLADRLARELCWPLLRIDDIAGVIPPNADYRFWDEKISVLLTISAAQLALGVRVIVDSVFMGADRLHAQEIARKHNALFRPVFCFVSDEALWEKRVTERFDALQNSTMVTWAQIQHQRQWFAPWQPNTALFVDAVEPTEQNYPRVLEFVTNSEIALEPLKINIPLVKGHYHQ